jgi:hypothetical protein
MPVLWALALSLSIHLAGLNLPGWSLPGDSEPSPTLNAQLRVPSSPASLPPATISPPEADPRRSPAIRKTGFVPEKTHGVGKRPVPTSPPVRMEETLVAQEGRDQEPPESTITGLPFPPMTNRFPAKGRIRYVGAYGEQGFMIGEMTTTWEITAEGYRIESRAGPRGLAAFFARQRQQISIGQVTTQGFRPSTYTDQLAGDRAQGVDFDWTSRQAALSRIPGRFPLPEGTQDPVSVFFQLAWMQPRQQVSVDVATLKTVATWTFEYLGEESLIPQSLDPAARGGSSVDSSLAGGISAASTQALSPVPSLHLRARADDETIDLWLAAQQGGLPLKIKIVDRKGKRYELLSDALTIGPHTQTPDPTSSPP